METTHLREKLAAKGLKVTHQRLCVLDAIHTLHNHPTADQILEYIKPTFPTIATGTVYKVLDTLVAHGLVMRVQNDKDVMRYDADVDRQHHHVYCTDCEAITDYESKELDNLLSHFFATHDIPNFDIDSIRLHIHGRYVNDMSPLHNQRHHKD